MKSLTTGRCPGKRCYQPCRALCGGLQTKLRHLMPSNWESPPNCTAFHFPQTKQTSTHQKSNTPAHMEEKQSSWKKYAFSKTAHQISMSETQAGTSGVWTESLKQACRRISTHLLLTLTCSTGEQTAQRLLMRADTWIQWTEQQQVTGCVIITVWEKINN